MYFPGKYRYFPKKVQESTGTFSERYRKVHVLSRKVQVLSQKGTGKYRYFPTMYRNSTGIIATGRNLIAFFFTEAKSNMHKCGEKKCRASYARLADYVEHLRVKHGHAQPIDCGVCNKGFSSNSSVRRHRKTVHPYEPKKGIQSKLLFFS